MTNANLHPHRAPFSFRGWAPLRASPSPLVAEVARLRREVRRLESALHMREHATAIGLHELRQPLSVLLMAAGHLGKGAVGMEKACADRVRAGAQRLDRLVEDLSDASLLESGRFTLHVRPTDVVQLVADSVAHLGSRALISIEGDIPRVDVDGRRVEQILTNLLSNAQKYGSPEAAPRVSIACSQDAVIVTVLNTGRGLAEDERIQVFEPYYRGRERRREAPGLGLGLYICKRLVEEHGGRIWTDGDALHTRFSFSIPTSDAAARPSEARMIAQRPSGADRERSG
jgi:signal transduction histidine kinase